MPELLVQEAKSALEAFATGVQQADTREEFDALLDDWTARDFHEAESYRGGFNRRGEIIAEAMKTMRALDGDARAMAEAERDRPPVFEAAKRLANGAALGAIAAESTWPVTQAAQPGEAFELADIAKMAVRVAPRLAGGAATALAWLLTPWNSQGNYRYWGVDGDHRVLIPPGDLTGRVERRDHTTGEWQPTGEVAREEWQDGRPVGLVIEPADAMWPEPAPSADRGFDPPAVPDTSREIFPSDRAGGVDTESFPAGSVEPETETVPVPDDAGPQILIFPDMSEEFRRLSTLESRRGNDATRDHLDQVRDWFLEQHPGWEHYRGGRHKKTGESKPEFWIPGLAHDFLDEKGRRGDGRPGGKWADLTFRSPEGRIVHIQTVDLDKNGKPTDRELQNAETIRRRTGATVYLIPKPGKRQ